MLNTLGRSLALAHPDANETIDADDAVLSGASLAERLRALHDEMRADPQLRVLDRVAVAVYDPREDSLQSFIHSGDGANPLARLTERLEALPGLLDIARSGRAIVVNDMAARPERHGPFTQRLIDGGHRARHIVPLRQHDEMYGFLCFNSNTANCFTPELLGRLQPYRRLIAMMVIGEIRAMRAMLAAVHTAREISHHRDEETGAHLDRMAHYSRIIARGLAEQHRLSDEFIEFLFQYAPLHDVGKVAIPDQILLKPGRLTPDEFTVMKEHVAKGVAIIDAIQRDGGLRNLPHAVVLRNIVGCHHEAFDGTGYPNGMAGLDIPLEGRIVAVADVFDALTSVRTYKDAWTNEAAVAHLREIAGTRLDPDCVHALLSQMDAVAGVQRRFRDEAPTPVAGSVAA